MSSKDLLNKQETKHNFLWVKFLTRFFLLISAAYNLIASAWYINRSQYQPAAIYEKFPKIQNIDFQYGILCCILFLMFLICIVLLSYYRRYADVFLYFCYMLDIVSTVVYVVLCVYTTKEIGNLGIYKEAFYNIGGCFLLLIINIIYFNKRSYAFR